MHVLTDAPPSVPQRGAPLVSVLTSRELKPKWEAKRLERLRKRHVVLKARDLRRRGLLLGEEDGAYDEEEEAVAMYLNRLYVPFEMLPPC